MNATPVDIALLGSFTASGTLTGVTTGTGAYAQPQNADRMAIAIIGIGTISGGTLILEEAWLPGQQPTYAGTASQLTSVTLSALTGGAQQVYHVPPNALYPVRARVSSDVTGGGSIVVVLRYQ